MNHPQLRIFICYPMYTSIWDDLKGQLTEISQLFIHISFARPSAMVLDE